MRMADERAVYSTAIFFCVHRGASSFVARQLVPSALPLLPGVRHVPVGEQVLRGCRFEDLALPPEGVIATRVYPEQYDRLVERPVPAGGRFARKRLVLVRRDPRDAAVSLYYSAAFSHVIEPGAARWLLDRRARLRALGLLEGIRLDTGLRAIREFRLAEALLARHPSICQAPYELLVTEPERWLRRVAGHLDWPDDLVDQLVPEVRRAVAPPAREDPHRHRRRVTPGNWREVLDDDLCSMFRDELGPALAEAGYDPGYDIGEPPDEGLRRAL